MSTIRHHLLFILLLAAPLAGHAEIFKWTDAEGRVHFGDKPTDQTIKAKEVEVKDYKPGSDEDTRAITERRQRLMNADADKGHDVGAEKKAMAEAKAKRCEEARSDLLKMSGRIAFLDDDGKPVHVTEQQRVARQKEIQAWIHDNCQ